MDCDDIHNDSITKLLDIVVNSRDRDEILSSIEKLRIHAKGNYSIKEEIGYHESIENFKRILISSDLQLQLAVAKLIRSILVCEKILVHLVEHGIVSILIKALSNTEDSKLKLILITTLWTLSVNDQNKGLIIDEGVLPYLANMIRSNNYSLQNFTLRTLKYILLNKKIYSSLSTECIIMPLIELLKSDNQRIRVNSATILKFLSMDERNLNIIKNEGSYSIVMDILGKKDRESDPSASIKLKIKNFENKLNYEELKFIRKIGEGKYADVHIAEYNCNLVACKVVRKKITEGESKSMFEELSVMNRLRNRNIVSFIGACLDPLNHLIIVMEYLSRGNLKDNIYLIQNIFLRLKIGRDIASGLLGLHSQGIIHRDLKFANILVDEDWTVKISDFGLSLDLRKDTVCYQFKGNVKYSSPEILSVRFDQRRAIYPYSEKTDVYSFGLMLWELISLKPLFPNLKSKEVFYNHIKSNNRPEMQPDWPSSLSKLLSDCWNSDLSRRPSFHSILKDYDVITLELICKDVNGREIIKKLWEGNKRNNLVPFSEFEKELPHETLSKIYSEKGCYRCFHYLSCENTEDDSVSLERFCKILAWFGPLDSRNLAKNITSIMSKDYFHGLITVSKASEIVKNCYKASERCCYLYHFGLDLLGSYFLTFVNDGVLSKLQFFYTSEDHGSFFFKESGFRFVDFNSLHLFCKEKYKLKFPIPGNPLKSFFSADIYRYDLLTNKLRK